MKKSAMERPVKHKSSTVISSQHPISATAPKSAVSPDVSKPHFELKRKFRSKFTVAIKPPNGHQLDSTFKTSKLAVPCVRSKLQLDTLKLVPMQICGSAHTTPVKDLVNLVKATHKYSARRSISAVEIRRGKPMAKCQPESMFQSILQTDAGAAVSAGEKIYNFMILSAWRNRRQEVAQLKKELQKTKSLLMCSKQRCHVMTALYESENKHYQNVRAENEQSQKQLLESFSELTRVKTEYAIIEQNCQKLQKENESLHNRYNHWLSAAHVSEFEFEQEKAKVLELKKKLEETTERFKFEFGNQTNSLLAVIKDQEREIDRNKEEILTLTDELQRLKSCDQIQQEIVEQLTLNLTDVQQKYRATIGYKTGKMVNSVQKIHVPWIWSLHLLGHRLVPIIPEPQLNLTNTSQTV